MMWRESTSPIGLCAPSATRSAQQGVSPLRVALITNVPVPYRAPALELLAQQPGIELHVIYCAPAYVDTRLNDFAQHYRTHWLKGRYRTYDRRFMHNHLGVVGVLQRLHPQVVITAGYIPTFLYAFAWARWAGAAHVAMTDGTLQSEQSLGLVHRVLRHVVLGRSAACIGASDGSLHLFRRYGVARDRLFKAPLAVPNERFGAGETARDADFLFCGRLLKFKGCGFALQVAAAVGRRLGRVVTIDFVGAGEYEAELRRQAQQLGDCVRARFLGYAAQEELPRHYAAARVFLFPSQSDVWGVVANEACAAGLPVIASPHAGAAGELVRDGHNGFVRELDVKTWADAAVMLLEDERLRRAMGERGRQLVNRYSYESAAEAMHAAVRRAVQPG